MSALMWLMLHLALLSLLAFGGVSTVLPEMHRYLVIEHHWLNDQQFGALYALSQSAPGPNMLYVALFGLQIAGIPGAIGSTLAITGPSSALVIAFTRYLHHHPDAQWYPHLRRALTPLSIGMVMASGWILANTNQAAPALLILTFGTMLLHWRTKINPVLLIVLGAIVGILSDN